MIGMSKPKEVATGLKRLLDQRLFAAIARECRDLPRGALLAVTPDGAAVFGAEPRGRSAALEREFRGRLTREAWRWGEAALSLSPSSRLACCVALTLNNELLGGLIVEAPLPDAKDDAAADAAARLRRTGDTLLALAIRHNLTNRAHLDLRRLESGREREKAEAIHALKESGYDTIREAYLREEPALLAAVKRGDRPAARDILNRLLVGIYHVGGNRLELLKSLTLELVVMIYRAAVEAGARPTELLGMNYDCVRRLAPITDEVQLCHWLTDMLERLMDGIREYRDQPNMVLLQQALRYMEQHLHRDLSRDEVARVACLSPGHFSHLLRRKVGHSFRELMMAYRMNRAAEALRRSCRSVAEIAVACGFNDPSHFGKAFRRRMGMTPLAYRQAGCGAKKEDRGLHPGPA
jgi:AraC-like DNA-binding protein